MQNVTQHIDAKIYRLLVYIFHFHNDFVNHLVYKQHRATGLESIELIFLLASIYLVYLIWNINNQVLAKVILLFSPRLTRNVTMEKICSVNCKNFNTFSIKLRNLGSKIETVELRKHFFDRFPTRIFKYLKINNSNLIYLKCKVQHNLSLPKYFEMFVAFIEI